MTDPTPLLQLLGNWGALGLLVGFLVWRDIRAADARDKLERENAAERVRVEERRIQTDRERLEADKALAASLASLTAVVQSLRR